MKEIKSMWESLTEEEQKGYDQKADFVNTKMKAKKFKTSSLMDKNYA